MSKLSKIKKSVSWLIGSLAGLFYSVKSVFAQVDWGMSGAADVALYGPSESVRQTKTWVVLTGILSILLIIIAFIIGVIMLLRKGVKYKKSKIDPAKSKSKGRNNLT
jgi:hypothetical protein